MMLCLAWKTSGILPLGLGSGRRIKGLIGDTLEGRNINYYRCEIKTSRERRN